MVFGPLAGSHLISKLGYAVLKESRHDKHNRVRGVHYLGIWGTPACPNQRPIVMPVPRPNEISISCSGDKSHRGVVC